MFEHPKHPHKYIFVSWVELRAVPRAAGIGIVLLLLGKRAFLTAFPVKSVQPLNDGGATDNTRLNYC